MIPEVDLDPGCVVIADLHLDVGVPEPSPNFVEFLRSCEGHPRLLILGDLFDYWVGPAQLSMEGAPRVLEALRALTAAGTAVDVLFGNRDFLLDRHFAGATGATLRPRGLLARHADGRRTLFVHGDELCTLDTGYQRLRRVLRSRPVQAIGPRLPLWVSRRIAGRLRRASSAALIVKPDEEKAMQESACRELAAAHAADTLVCGHAHAFRDEALADGPRWIVLDAFGDERDVLELAEGGEWRVRSSRPGSTIPRPMSDPPLIVAIDGPAAAGKSTVSRRVAERLGIRFLDTGSMYRAVTWVALERGVAPDDEAGCAAVARSLRLGFDDAGHILVDGAPGEPHIRSTAVSAAVSAVSAHSGVRAAIVPLQREAARAAGGVVAEGRDTTTVVFPDATFKFFLWASPEERAARRAREQDEPERVGEIQAAIERRDRYDSERADSPLRQAEDAVRIETDGLTPDQVVDRILAIVAARAGER